MKLKSLLILSAFAALPVFAGLQRGPIVPEAGRSLIVDFNHDGLDDAIDSALDGTHLLLNSGGVLVRAGDLPIPGRSTLIAAADVNGDGNVDILASSVGSGTPGSRSLLSACPQGGRVRRWPMLMVMAKLRSYS